MELSREMREQFELLRTLILTDQIPMEYVPRFVLQYPGLGEYMLEQSDAARAAHAPQRSA